MKDVGARTHLFSLTQKRLDDLIALPDEEAAKELQCRLAGIETVEELHERSYAEVGIIAGQFKTRHLWQLLDNPVSGEPFTTWSAWATASGVRCRRIIFEAAKDMDELKDIAVDEIREVSKSTIKQLKRISSKVRNEPKILEAARTLGTDDFIAKVDADYPDQHLGGRPKTLRFVVTPDEFNKAVEIIKYAIDNGIAGNWGEAMMRALETAHDEWINERLALANDVKRSSQMVN